jgi:hypothetical protein
MYKTNFDNPFRVKDDDLGLSSNYGMWNITEQIQTPIDIKVSTTVDGGTFKYVGDEYLQAELIKKLSMEIFKNKCVTIQQEPNNGSNIFNTTYTAKITVAPSFMTNIVLEKHQIKIGNVSFNEEQIISGLKRAYPEMFI